VSRLEAVRFGFVLLCVAVLAAVIWRRQRVVAALKVFLFAPEGPYNLALLRMFVFGTICWDALTTRADFVATLSPRFLKLRWGWFWLSNALEAALPYTGAAKLVLIVSAACAALGLFTRAAAIVTALLAVYVFGIANFYFRLMHNLHVEVLCAMVLAASRAGDALSLDNLLRRRRGQPAASSPSSAYTFPIRACWLLLGVSYLYPGLLKLWDTGDLWLQGVKPHVDILQKWTEFPDRLPPIDVDRYPILLPILGANTLVFEIGFTFALFWRSSRVIAGIVGVGFHLGIMLFMNIWFSPFLPLMVFCDFPGVLGVRPFGRLLTPIARAAQRLASGVGAWAGRDRPGSARSRRLPSLVPPLVVGTSLLGAMYVAGAVDLLSWPIARFPTFSKRPRPIPPKALGLAFHVKRANGEVVVLKDAIAPLGGDGVVGHNVIRAIRALRGRSKSEEAFQRSFAHWAKMLAQTVRESSGPFDKGDRLLIYTFEFSVVPAKRKHDQRELSLVTEIDL
jgi:hypothetical protein